MKTYTTKQGDMWDAIARRVYPNIGAEYLMSVLIDANPRHGDTVIFSGGVVLDVPEICAPTTSNLPPWKR